MIVCLAANPVTRWQHLLHSRSRPRSHSDSHPQLRFQTWPRPGGTLSSPEHQVAPALSTLVGRAITQIAYLRLRIRKLCNPRVRQAPAIRNEFRSSSVDIAGPQVLSSPLMPEHIAPPSAWIAISLDPTLPTSRRRWHHSPSLDLRSGSAWLGRYQKVRLREGLSTVQGEQHAHQFAKPETTKRPVLI
jgi:hypothetical protein